MSGARFFTASCPSCEQEAKFVELRVEACVQPESDEPKAWWGFKCLACDQRLKEVEGPDGVHRYEDGEHVVS